MRKIFDLSTFLSARADKIKRERLRLGTRLAVSRRITDFTIIPGTFLTSNITYTRGRANICFTGSTDHMMMWPKNSITTRNSF